MIHMYLLTIYNKGLWIPKPISIASVSESIVLITIVVGGFFYEY